jgi:hypothetical protein
MKIAGFTLAALIVPVLLLTAQTRASRDEQREAVRTNLARLAGDWSTEVVMSGAPPVAGQASLRLFEGGSWILEDFSADMGGQPFRGHGLLGWDAGQEACANVWVDSLDGKLTTGSGAWDEDQQAFVLRAEIDMGGGPAPVRETWRIEGPDALTFTMAPDQDGAAPAMTIRYRRR